MEANNNQKMCDVIDEIKNIANSALTTLSIGNCPSSLLWDIIRKCETALATPRRNCDVGTAEEQVKRFATFCLFRKCDKCELDNDSNFLDCGIRWAQLPYVKGENR